MQRSSARRRIGNRAPLAAIQLRQSPGKEERSRSAVLLVVFMRLVAVVWIVEGLMQWNLVLANNADGHSELTILSTQATVAVVFFGVIDLIAAVGLWLAAPWGGVIWLATAGAQLFVITTVPGFYVHPWIMGLTTTGLVGLYMVLIWQESRAGTEQLNPP